MGPLLPTVLPLVGSTCLLPSRAGSSVAMAVALPRCGLLSTFGSRMWVECIFRSFRSSVVITCYSFSPCVLYPFLLILQAMDVGLHWGPPHGSFPSWWTFWDGSTGTTAFSTDIRPQPGCHPFNRPYMVSTRGRWRGHGAKVDLMAEGDIGN